MNNIKRISCFFLAALFCILVFAGCKEEKEVPDILTESSSVTKKEAENRDDLNSILKSWEIFSEAAQGQKTDMESETMTDTIKKAIESEADNKRVDITLVCSRTSADEYKNITGEFKWLYADDERYTLNINIIPVNDTSEKNISDPKNAADVFFLRDNRLSGAVSSGAAAKINEELGKIASGTDTENSISACTINQKMYGFPAASAKGSCLVYDKRVFKEENTFSIEKMIDTAAGASKNVLYAIDQPYNSTEIFLSAGCSITNEDEMQTIDINSKNGIAACRSMCALAKKQGKGFIGTGTSEDIISGFTLGIICAAVTDQDTAAAVKNIIGEENTGIAKLPTLNISGKDVQLHSFEGFETAAVNPYSRFPFTAQLLAYYISSEKSQTALYYATGSIPAAVIQSYSPIAQDPFYQIMDSQKEYSHVYSQTISPEAENLLSEKNIGKTIIEKNGSLSDDQLISIIAAIPIKLPLSSSRQSGAEDSDS